MRLTAKAPRHATHKYMICANGNIIRHDAIDKLGMIEDKEASMGIDVLTLIKAQEEGIWTLSYDKNGNLVPMKLNVSVYVSFANCALVNMWKIYPFGCYGKKTAGGWALTREELE